MPGLGSSSPLTGKFTFKEFSQNESQQVSTQQIHLQGLAWAHLALHQASSLPWTIGHHQKYFTDSEVAVKVDISDLLHEKSTFLAKVADLVLHEPS